MPNWKTALLPVDLKHRSDHIVLPFRMQDCHQRHLGAISIPKGECGIFSPRIIQITEYRRHYHRVVKRCVENCSGFRIISGHLSLGEFRVPSLAGCIDRGLEVPARKFRRHIQSRLFLAGRGDRDLQHHLLAFGGVEVGAEVVH